MKILRLGFAKSNSRRGEEERERELEREREKGKRLLDDVRVPRDKAE